MSRQPVFSIITLAYRRLEYLREAVEAMRGQTYRNVEIIVVNNGAIPSVAEYLCELEAVEPRVKLVHFKENQYRDDDPMRIVDVCFNAGLKAATGEYVFYQSDDDLIGKDFAAKMTTLFLENPACTSAAGRPVSIGPSGELLEEGVRCTNFRPRYMPGHLVALSILNSRQRILRGIMYMAPGMIFVLKREDLVRAGGYQRAIEAGHLYGIVPFGVTGFDETALLYWRRHPGQLNLDLSAKGFVGFKENFLLINDMRLLERWKIFGDTTAKFVVGRLKEEAVEQAVRWFVVHVYSFRLWAALRLLCGLWIWPYFWQRIFPVFWEQKRIVYHHLRAGMKGIIKGKHG